jgi:DNA repair exonuclease SbcCD nuclease subunit
MERTKTNKTPTAILTSDWHLREDTPICRTDDYWETQWKKVRSITALQTKYQCSIIHAGDLFDKWKPSPYLLRETIKNIPKQFYTIYGQHDLPQHSLELVNKCGINVLEAARKLKVLEGCHWGQNPNNLRIGYSVYWEDNNTFQPLAFNGKILVWHKMTYQGKKPWPGCTDPMAVSLLRKYPQFDLIITGDNHKSFSEEYEGRWLVNPGSLMRMDADQVNHHPCVYAWYAETNTISLIPLPHEPNVISREHIEVKEQRDARIDAFVSRLDGDWEVAMSFEQNLEEFFKVNNIREPVKEIIYKSLE